MLLKVNRFEANFCVAGWEAIKATEYTGLGRVTEFKYGKELGNAFRGRNAIRWLRNFGMSKRTVTVRLWNSFVEIITTQTDIDGKFSFMCIAI
jgi:hypothetical protein